ncbi:DUF2188 domain-containing protein [Psychroflexus lacisalsi]|jgi:hypothetical protein|uniref:DUF2188 domain-containing protein n=1 Tax=Psychroflexus lacisalsi TaxID=503928 RepID=A0ABN1K1H4_9FLAO|nr:DUF2188 domain-containing protein [Psychroflexus lacisalsi]MBZ9620736.1 DUF2188 domain-containing protein [Psychroflexus lacisalsi]
MAKKSNSRHVVPNQDGGWSSKKAGASKSSKKIETKKEAENWSRELSRKEKTELVIHKKDGTIQRKDSHGNDSTTVKG